MRATSGEAGSAFNSARIARSSTGVRFSGRAAFGRMMRNEYRFKFSGHFSSVSCWNPATASCNSPRTWTRVTIGETSARPVWVNWSRARSSVCRA